ncbi:ABC transporter ATP-binding protein [Natronospora cellulosivora (SeqCode)]
MTTILKARDICKTYVLNKRKSHVLKNVDISIKKGEFLSVMGPSGSGKSTLLYNISGMDKMTSGNVSLDDKNLEELSEKELSNLRLNKMGFVFQQINLVKNLGILDNIILPAYMAKKRSREHINKKAIELMKKAGIVELAEHDITQVSGGQLQRAAICRALVNDPLILFGDEPTGALNTKASRDILDIFHNINEEGTTVMLVTHDVKVAAQSERVLFMMDGSIVGEYKLEKFKKSNEDLVERERKLSKWLLDMGF